MKKIATVTIAALVALAPLSGAALAQGKAPAEKKIERPAAQKTQKQQTQKQQWKKGAKYSGKGSSVSNHSRYKLDAPPKGHRWVRDGDNFILVATATGVIASIVAASGR